MLRKLAGQIKTNVKFFNCNDKRELIVCRIDSVNANLMHALNFI